MRGDEQNEATRGDEQNEATQNGVALSDVEQKNVTHKNAI